jgi:carbon starvation protein CstA
MSKVFRAATGADDHDVSLLISRRLETQSASWRPRMHESKLSPSRFRWTALLWFLPAALVLLVVGIWAQAPWWVVALWMTVPLALGVTIGVFGGRRTTVADGAYGITSQGEPSRV